MVFEVPYSIGDLVKVPELGVCTVTSLQVYISDDGLVTNVRAFVSPFNMWVTLLRTTRKIRNVVGE